jgi:hypothetical protein
LVLAQHAPKFPEGKQRNENAKYNDAAAEQIIDAYLMERSCDTYSMQKSFDPFLHKVKSEHKQAK